MHPAFELTAEAAGSTGPSTSLWIRRETTRLRNCQLQLCGRSSVKVVICVTRVTLYIMRALCVCVERAIVRHLPIA